MNACRYLAHAAVVGVSGLLATVSQSSLAGGFELLHQSERLLGTAFAGTAVVDDASAAFFNPASLALVGCEKAEKARDDCAGSSRGWQFILGTAVIFPSSHFSNSGSTPALGASLGSEGGNAGSTAYLPAIDVAYHSGDQWGVGLSIGAPFGLKTEYTSDWMGRYISIKSSLKTIETTLSGSYQIAPKFWLGAGVSYLTADSDLTNAVNWGPFGDGLSQLETQDFAWGYNLGALWKSDKTRIGLNYRSGYDLNLTGGIETSFPGTPAQLALLGPQAQAAFNAANGAARAELNLPSTATLSVKQGLGQKWEILADLAWVHWDVFKQFEVVRDNGLVLTKAPQNWTDTWRFALGATYELNDKVKLRGGVAYDQSPVPDQYRNPSVPDNDWRWFTLGAQFTFSRAVRVDVAYAYISAKTATINASRYDAAGNPDPATSGTLVGSYTTYSNTIGVQVVINLDK